MRFSKLIEICSVFQKYGNRRVSKSKIKKKSRELTGINGLTVQEIYDVYGAMVNYIISGKGIKPLAQHKVQT